MEGKNKPKIFTDHATRPLFSPFSAQEDLNFSLVFADLSMALVYRLQMHFIIPPVKRVHFLSWPQPSLGFCSIFEGLAVLSPFFLTEKANLTPFQRPGRGPTFRPSKLLFEGPLNIFVLSSSFFLLLLYKCFFTPNLLIFVLRLQLEPS